MRRQGHTTLAVVNFLSDPLDAATTLDDFIIFLCCFPSTVYSSSITLSKHTGVIDGKTSATLRKT